MRLSNIEVKKMNRNSILQYMLKADAVQKNTIAEDIRLSFPTVTQGLKDLEEIGLIKEEGTLKSIGGRKAMSYRCVKDAKVALGLDITRNHINIVMINLAREIMYSRRVRMRIHDKAESYEKLKATIEEFIKESRIPEKKILGLGISLPAIIDETGTKMHALHEQMEISYRLYDIVKKWFSFPIILENDANSAGKAEMNFRGTKRESVYLFVSQTVGGAIIIDGNVFYGKMRRGGEFGHITLYPGGKPCFCGRKGCINAYCATKVLSDMTNDDLNLFFEGLEQKNEKYIKAWNQYLDDLALAIHDLNMAFDSEVIIGGYLGQYIGLYMEELRERVKKLDPFIEDLSFIIPAALKYEASAIGVADVFIEKFISSI
ncbi:putative NBD/HSP70 family sugar kinase [Aequitasia blattaphilus]